MFQSPEDLKGRIIISDKPPGEPVGKQVRSTICIMHCLIAFRKLLQLSFNSMELFVGSWSSMNFFPLVGGMLGGIVCIEMKSNLLLFIEGQTHFSTSWHSKMSLTLNEQI
jgi:hypothetical protein